MIELDLDKEDCENAAEFLELEFFNHIYTELEIGDLDNIGYVKSIIRAMEALYKAAGREPSGVSYTPTIGGNKC